MDRGYFITFEGPEGSGKSTQVSLLSDALTRHSIEHVTTREPGGTDTARQLRRILLDRRTNDLGPRAELLLLMAARADHVRKVISPGLAAGKVVICDRFADSSIAYQGGGRGLDIEDIELVNSFATNNLKPDLTFLIDIDPEVGLRRAGGRQGALQLDRLESAGLDFHYKVRETYLAQTRRYPDRFLTIDGLLDRESISRRIIERTLELCRGGR